MIRGDFWPRQSRWLTFSNRLLGGKQNVFNMWHPDHWPVQEAAISCVATHTFPNTNKHLQHNIPLSSFPQPDSSFPMFLLSFDSILISLLTPHTHSKPPPRSPISYYPPYSGRELCYLHKYILPTLLRSLETALKMMPFRTIHSVFILVKIHNVSRDLPGNSVSQGTR